MITGGQIVFDILGVADCGSVARLSQHTGTLCNTLQHAATHCNTLQHTATHYDQKWSNHLISWVLQNVAMLCVRVNTLQHSATHCNTLQHAATHCYTLQHAGTHYYHKWTKYSLQHLATYCNTLLSGVVKLFGRCRLLRCCAVGSTHCQSPLQHNATHCNTLQHTTTHSNTLQHTDTPVAVLRV